MPKHELLSPAQRIQYTEIPSEISDRDMARYYTLLENDLAVINRHRGAHNRLGFAVQLCILRFPGRTLNPREQIPECILLYIAEQLNLSPDVMQDYAERDTTRREHISEIRNTFGYRTFTAIEYKELAKWLLPIAMSTDKGTVLVDELIKEMRARKIIVPGIFTIERLGWTVRRRAQLIVLKQFTGRLTDEQRKKLDMVLKLKGESNQTYLSWLRQPPSAPSPKSFLNVVERLNFIREISINPDTTRQIHQNRLLQLAREGARYSPQHLSRLNELRRYATLVAFLLETSENLVDQAIDIHDKMIGKLFNRGEKAHLDNFQKSGKSINEKVRLYIKVGKALITAKEKKEDPFEVLQSIISWDKFVISVKEAEVLARPSDFDYLDMLKNKYNHLRKYTPELLETFEFKAAPPSVPLLEALNIIKEMNRTGSRKVIDSAPIEFIKPRWKKHVFNGDKINRRYYEICALSELRNHLRSGDIWVIGSRQYRDFEEYLIPSETWREMCQSGDIPVAVPTNPDIYLEKRKEELNNQLTTVSKLLSKNKLVDVSLQNGELCITPLQKAVPEGIDEVTRRAYDLLPRIKLTDLLVEVDTWIPFSQHFTHLHTGEKPKEKSVLFTVILADAINLGLTKMAEACPGMSFDRLAWVSDWYIRDDTYSKALAEVVNFHHQLPFSYYWGDGTTSSSDGQRFKAGGQRGLTSQVNAKYGREPGVTFYSHISDQYTPFYVKVISSAVRDATYVLDGLLYHETELQLQEHYTDTAGYTDHVFAMFYLLGFRFAPRIRDLGDKRMYTFEKPSEYPVLESLLSGTINVKKIKEHWDAILRLASSIRRGTVTASLMLRKLASYPRQNSLAWALREIGRIEKTLFTLDWLQDPELRRRVQVGLNKGEAKNALARAVFFNRLGEIRDRSYEDQYYRASGLNLVVSSIILWNTVYLNQAVEVLKSQGMEITKEQLQHLSPLGWEHINLTGDYIWNLKQNTNLNSLRPLRMK